VELPLTHPEYYEEMGIKPPKGVILHGAPGTGKTLLAKAVANQTSATFLRVVGSELIQKYLVSLFIFWLSHCNDCDSNRAMDPNL
jgi:26S proteasome regulatory subunit T2